MILLKSKQKIVIAGGGTGGHVYVALAIAQGLLDKGMQKNQIVFFGSKRTIENELVPAKNYTLVTFPGRGLNRNELLKNLWNIVTLKVAILKALFILIKSRPKLVVGVGGYASVPALIAASILCINRVVHEQNSVVGRTNLLAQKLGAKVITSFPETFGSKSASVYLGLPLSDDMATAIKLHNEADFKNRNTKQVVVSGGSLGSVVLNAVLVQMVSKYRDLIDFRIVHICGKNNFSKTEQLYLEQNCLELVELDSYRNDLLNVYAKSDCVVSRSGAGTCFELDTLGIRCILVPLASAPRDHQMLNAKYLESRGVARIISQNELDEDVLYATISDLLKNPESIAPNEFNLESKSRISDYLISQYDLIE